MLYNNCAVEQPNEQMIFQNLWEKVPDLKLETSFSLTNKCFSPPLSHWTEILWLDMFPCLFKNVWKILNWGLKNPLPGDELGTSSQLRCCVSLVLIDSLGYDCTVSQTVFVSLMAFTVSSWHWLCSALPGALKCCEVYVRSWLTQIRQGLLQKQRLTRSCEPLEEVQCCSDSINLY